MVSVATSQLKCCAKTAINYMQMMSMAVFQHNLGAPKLEFHKISHIMKSYPSFNFVAHLIM